MSECQVGEIVAFSRAYKVLSRKMLRVLKRYLIIKWHMVRKSMMIFVSPGLGKGEFKGSSSGFGSKTGNRVSFYG